MSDGARARRAARHKQVCVKGTVSVIKDGMMLIVQKIGKIWCKLEGDYQTNTFVKNDHVAILGMDVKMNGYGQLTGNLLFNLTTKSISKIIKINCKSL